MQPSYPCFKPGECPSTWVIELHGWGPVTYKDLDTDYIPGLEYVAAGCRCPVCGVETGEQCEPPPRGPYDYLPPPVNTLEPFRYRMSGWGYAPPPDAPMLERPAPPPPPPWYQNGGDEKLPEGHPPFARRPGISGFGFPPPGAHYGRIKHARKLAQKRSSTVENLIASRGSDARRAAYERLARKVRARSRGSKKLARLDLYEVLAKG